MTTATNGDVEVMVDTRTGRASCSRHGVVSVAGDGYRLTCRGCWGAVRFNLRLEET